MEDEDELEQQSFLNSVEEYKLEDLVKPSLTLETPYNTYNQSKFMSYSMYE